MTERKNTKQTNKKSRIPKTSRSPIVFDYDEVERLAGLGLTNDKIALALGCSIRTIHNRLNESAEFAEAYARGRTKREIVVADKLAQNCDNGDTNAIKFYLQSVANWKERQDISMQAEVTTLDISDLPTQTIMQMLEELKDIE